jgi:hypothetical protein
MQNSKKNSYYDPVLTLNGLVGKATVLPSAPIKIYVLVAIGERLRWSRSSVLAFGTRVRGFRPGRSRGIFRAKKILSTLSFGGEVKPSVPRRA